MDTLEGQGRRRRYTRWICASVVAILIAGTLGASIAPAAPQSMPIGQPIPANPAFQQVWNRTDFLVQQTKVQRSFYWGWAVKQPFYERYDEGPGGKHLVQYFDKARMEINDPGANRDAPFYVTNGHLSREMVTGRVQVGNNTFVQLEPAEVDIASDTDDLSPGTPTYASFRNLIRSDREQVGGPVVSTINRAGETGSDASYFTNYQVSYAYYEPATKNNIPDVFWDFLNLTGPVTVGFETINARLSDPYFYVTGYPISTAYWARTKIAGKINTPVLIQVYERRVLTYVPSAPEGWRVQMGNVGLHYFEWRYSTGRNMVSYLGCEAPAGKTGALWFARPEVQRMVGCTNNYFTEQGMTVAHQTFQRGEMLDLINGTGLKTIYVLYEGGVAEPYQDQFDGGPEPPSNPPPGLYAPRGGFGKVWREKNLQARLGWATAPETVATYDFGSEPALPLPVPTALPGLPTPTPAPPAPPTPTVVPASGRGFPAVLRFGRGNFPGEDLIIYTGPALHRFYVTYELGRRWAAFDDTFK